MRFGNQKENCLKNVEDTWERKIHLIDLQEENHVEAVQHSKSCITFYGAQAFSYSKKRKPQHLCPRRGLDE